MIRTLFLTLAAALVLAGCEPSGSGGTSKLDESTITRHVDTVNAYRSEAGLQPVQVNSELTAAARTHARDMAVQKRAWHFGSDGTSPKDRAERAGYSGEVLGENISESYDSEFTLIQSWINDPTTRRVMLNPAANEIGLGWFEETSGKRWWVEVYGRRGASVGYIGG
jgi:uncharacterized protein YkwD